jgi:hypothetical protein
MRVIYHENYEISNSKTENFRIFARPVFALGKRLKTVAARITLW